MDAFARIVIGFHGCTEEFARELLLGDRPINAWQPSTNDWDWLGHGIYLWEHASERALRWAQEKHGPRGQKPAGLGAVLQLGRCFDLLDEAITSILTDTHRALVKYFGDHGQALPSNRGKDQKQRDLDCLVINDCLEKLSRVGLGYDTVRGAFLEGESVYPGAGFSRESHIQIAVRNPACILGVFRPNLSI
jgi:hypothetical protein